MLRTALAATMLAASATLAFAAADDELGRQLAGSWGADAACANWSVTFDADGSYTLDRPGTDNDQTGTWSISAGVLSLAKNAGNPEPDATIVFEGDTVTFVGTDRGKTFEQHFTRCGG